MLSDGHRPCDPNEIPPSRCKTVMTLGARIGNQRFVELVLDIIGSFRSIRTRYLTFGMPLRLTKAGQRKMSINGVRTLAFTLASKWRLGCSTMISEHQWNYHFHFPI
jgi:hypothetical protein